MPRVRLGVALLVPEPLATEIDGLRRAADDGALDRVPPHLTLVPPVNVRVADVPAALRVLRRAAAASGPLALRLGPPVTFHPATPTLHLAVGGRGEATTALRRLRDAVFAPPLERTLTFPWVPHVTLADDMEPDRIDAAVRALSGYVVEASFDRLHLLEEGRHGDAHRVWRPVADAPLGPPVVVGRGGFELELTASVLVDPEARHQAVIWLGKTPTWLAPPAGARPVVITARNRDAVVGVLRGWARGDESEITWAAVAPDQRGRGVARHLAVAFEQAALA